jgi:nucleoside-diphosphate-sugar epimerase
LVVPRIFNVGGPLINKHDSYVLSSVINAALSGAPIELHARRKVVRGYVALRDVLEVLFGWLLSSTMPEQLVLDTGGQLVEAEELAKRVLNVLHRPDLPIHRPPLGSEPDDVYFGDGAEFERLAGLQGVALSPLDDQIAETAAYLKQTQAAR